MPQENFVVTIAREYGSGGRLIGQRLAELLGIAFYDKELISLAAKQSGFSEDILRQHDQNKRRLSLINNIYINNANLPLSEQIYQAQCSVIQNIARKSSCVIVGRCADHVLSDNPRCIKVFVHASVENKVKRIVEEYGENSPSPAAYAAKIDKERAAHYNYFTLEKWGLLRNYHLTVNSGIGIEASAQVIKLYVEQFLSTSYCSAWLSR